MIVTVTFNPSFDKTLQVPGFTAGQTVKVRTLRRQPAGKGVNVSRCIAALGGCSVVTGFLGRAEAEAYARSFEGTGTTVSFVSVQGDTRQNTTILDPRNGTETHLREEGFTVGEEDIAALQQRLAEIARQGDLVIFAGSLAPGMEPEHMARFVAQCKAIGCTVAADTSGPALARAVSADCSIIKSNLEELQEVTGETIGDEKEILSAAQALLCHVKILLVTLGEEGAWCFTRDGVWKANVKVKRPVNTVGAGDAFLAGFAAGFVDGLPLDASLRKAVACAAASTLKHWAGEIDPATVESFMKKAEVVRVGASEGTA